MIRRGQAEQRRRANSKLAKLYHAEACLSGYGNAGELQVPTSVDRLRTMGKAANDFPPRRAFIGKLLCAAVKQESNAGAVIAIEAAVIKVVGKFRCAVGR